MHAQPANDCTPFAVKTACHTGRAEVDQQDVNEDLCCAASMVDVLLQEQDMQQARLAAAFDGGVHQEWQDLSLAS